TGTTRQPLGKRAGRRAASAVARATILGVAVDRPEDEAKVRTLAQGLAAPVMIASEEVASKYSILSRYLFDRREDLRLPTVFLVNGQGEIVKVYREDIAAAEIAEDVTKIDAPPAERLARPVPFPGRLLSRPAPG